MNASLTSPKPQKSLSKSRLAVDLIVHGLGLFMALPSVLMLANLMISGDTSNSRQLAQILHISGEASERLLIASLLCTPLYIVFGWTAPQRYKKWLGLYAGLPLLAHVVAQLVKHNFAFSSLFDGLSLTIGTVATVIMIILSLTSFDAVIKVMGKAWKKLHYSVYAVGIFMEIHVATLHLPRIDGHGIVFGAIVLVLLALRLPPVRRFFVGLRQSRNTVRAA